MADETVNQQGEELAPSIDDFLLMWDNASSTTRKLAISTLKTLLFSGAGTLSSQTLTNPYKFSVYRTAAYTSVSSATTPYPFDTKEFDTGSNVDIVTNQGRFTAPVAGYYFFNGKWEIGGSTTTVGIATLLKNGAEAKRGNDLRSSVANKGLVVSGLLPLAANDYVELGYFIDSAAAFDVSSPSVNNYLQGFLVSAT